MLFVGLGVDFGIQFSVRYRAERHDYPDLHTALVSAARKAGGPLALAAVGTTVGFCSFAPTAYRGLGESQDRRHRERPTRSAYPFPAPAEAAERRLRSRLKCLESRKVTAHSSARRRITVAGLPGFLTLIQVPRPARSTPAIPPFRDNALQEQPARVLEHQLGLAVEVVGVRDTRPLLREQPPELRLALLQRLLPTVIAVQLKEIERVQ
jgi:hypothetical protein